MTEPSEHLENDNAIVIPENKPFVFIGWVAPPWLSHWDSDQGRMVPCTLGNGWCSLCNNGSRPLLRRVFSARMHDDPERSGLMVASAAAMRTMNFHEGEVCVRLGSGMQTQYKLIANPEDYK